MKINQENFYIQTFGKWELANTPTRSPDYVSGYSKYWYNKQGVYRLSDHWGQHINTCDWSIITKPDRFSIYKTRLDIEIDPIMLYNKPICGYIKFDDLIYDDYKPETFNIFKKMFKYNIMIIKNTKNKIKALNGFFAYKSQAILYANHLDSFNIFFTKNF